MKSFSAETTIHATPDRVWQVLTNAAEYPNWDPNMVRLDGTIALGQKVTAHTKLSDRAFPLTVTKLDADKMMVWSGGMPLGLFTGERTFTLTAKADDQTHVHVKEVFRGPLSPIFGRMIPDLQPSFDAFVEGLKSSVESDVRDG